MKTRMKPATVMKSMAVCAIAAATLVAGQGMASANQDWTINVGQDRDFATRFGAPTKICLFAVGTGGADGKAQWWSFLKSGNIEGIAPGTQTCFWGNYGGWRIKFHNWGYYPLRITFPDGP